MLRKTATAILVSVVLYSSAPRAEDTQRVLLWNLDAGAELSAEEKITVQNLIAAEITKRGYEVMTEGEVGRIFQLEEKLQLCGSNESCIVEIGSAMGAKEGVSGSLARIGSTLVFTMQRMDMYAARVVQRSTRKTSRELEAVLDLIPSMIAELYTAARETAEPVVSVTEATTDYPMNPYKFWGHASVWSGLGVMLLGAVMTTLSDSAESDAKTAGPPSAMADAESRMDTFNALAVTGYSLGGALVVTGVVLWVLSPGDRKWVQEHGISVLPFVSGDRAGLSLTWEF